MQNKRFYIIPKKSSFSKPGRNAPGGPCTFAIFKEDDLKGEVYKARAVVQGCRQQEGIHFNKYRVSSPVADLMSIRILTSIATEANYPIHHLDIKSAYLNASLPEGEEIYVRPPRGFSSKDGYCWKLKKSVYGMKQSGYEWYMCLADKLKKIGLRPLGSQGTIFTKQSIVGKKWDDWS